MMYKIQTLNNISDVIHQSLTAERYLIAKEEPVPDGILVQNENMAASLALLCKHLNERMKGQEG